jgi:hypothetical protein
MKKMERKIDLLYDGRLYGELELMREDFANVLRALHFDVVEDVSIKGSDFGANPEAVRKFCMKTGRTFVTLIIGSVPFYYAVRQNSPGELASRLEFLRCLRCGS